MANTDEYFYGNGTTIHDTDYVHVETHKGEVVAVWFRCATLPFSQVEVSPQRVNEMKGHHSDALVGVTFTPLTQEERNNLTAQLREDSKTAPSWLAAKWAKIIEKLSK